MSDPIVLIPARLAATRLPRKPLADIFGEPMIVHVWRRAIEAGIGPVVVAADSPEIVAAVEAAGGVGVLTAVDHPSGTDRLAEALAIVDAFLATPWSEEARHQRRIDILAEYERTGEAPEVPGAPAQ